MSITDPRRRSHGRVYLADVENGLCQMSGRAARLYLALVAHANGAGACYVGRRRLRELLGASGATVEGAIAELVDGGWLRVEPGSGRAVSRFFILGTTSVPTKPPHSGDNGGYTTDCVVGTTSAVVGTVSRRSGDNGASLRGHTLSPKQYEQGGTTAEQGLAAPAADAAPPPAAAVSPDVPTRYTGPPEYDPTSPTYQPPPVPTVAPPHQNTATRLELVAAGINEPALTRLANRGGLTWKIVKTQRNYCKEHGLGVGLLIQKLTLTADENERKSLSLQELRSG